jgi:uncharacterized membrane protein
MEGFLELWPVISGLIAVGAIGVAFRAEITVRVKVLESKVETLFSLFNKSNERKD